jgi:hypothetical protein
VSNSLLRSFDSDQIRTRTEALKQIPEAIKTHPNTLATRRKSRKNNVTQTILEVAVNTPNHRASGVKTLRIGEAGDFSFNGVNQLRIVRVPDF